MKKNETIKTTIIILIFISIFVLWTASMPKGTINTKLEKIVVKQSREDNWKEVYATRIGLVGNTTASGHIIKEEDIFVALPSRMGLNKTVSVIFGNKQIRCKVLDVGPWSTQDPYWLNNETPLAEHGKQKPTRSRRVTNKAGIDLSDGAWDALGIERGRGVVIVKWRFEVE